MGKPTFALDEILTSIDLLFAFDTPGGSEEDAEDDSMERIKRMDREHRQEFHYSKEELEAQGFGAAQLEEIENGAEKGLAVQRYARTCYNWKQMRELRLGLEERLEIGLYDNDLFSAEQMKEIRMGLEEHLDAASYARLVLSASDMAAARKKMMREAYLQNPNGHGKVFEDESGVCIRLSDDCMEAYLTLPKDRSFGVSELERILKRNDVTDGILRDRLKQAALGELPAGEFLAAKGTRAKTGEDGCYEFLFRTAAGGAPIVREDGSVDYTQAVVADKRRAGDTLAKYHPARRGTDGKTVTGIFLKGVRGKELPSLHGQGIRYEEETKLYTAAASGYVLLNEKEHTLNIWEIYVVDGDVNRYNGQINYDGIVHIKGAVGDLAKIEATGNVLVDGYVEGAKIRAGGDIILRSGMNGNQIGALEAGGNVTGRFFEAASIRAKGDVEGSYFMNCNIVTEKSLRAKEFHSKIVGGTVKAGYSVEVSSVLSSGRMKTAIDVGDPVWMEQKLKETKEQLSQTEAELKKLSDGKEKVSEMLGTEAEKQNALFHQICVAIQMKEEEAQQLREELQYREQLRTRAKKAYVQIFDLIQPGVTLTICGKKRKIEQEQRGAVTFRKTEA